MKRKQLHRRLLSLLFLTASMLSAVPALAADVTFTIGLLTYTGYDSSDASVSKCDKNAVGELIIPESVEYKGVHYSVASIGSLAFQDCSSLTSVTIPNSVTYIGSDAFNGCSGLTSMEIPNSVTNIDYAAFRNCSGLTSMEIPNSVTSIGGSAFQGCSSLASVTIPNSVTSIGEQAFRECSSLTNIQVESGNTNYCSVDGVLFNSDESELVMFPAGKAGEYKILTSVTHICDYAFWGCSNLSSVYIPSSVRSIGRRAFPGCSSLTNIQVESGNTNYCSSDGILFNSAKSELVIFPAGRTGEYQIPNSVTKIGDYAFYGRSSLTSVEMPSSVTYIGEGAFQGCRGLTSVEIPNTVRYVGEHAFHGCSNLTSVTIPTSVTNLGESAFENCSSLTTVEIPNSVTHIGYHTFAGCSSLTLVKIPTSVTSIGFQVIYGCSSLTTLIIPSSVTDIQSGAFMGCDNLKSIYLFGKCSHNLGVESVYTFYDNGYHFDNAVYLVGEISTTRTTAEFDVQKIGEVESFDFEYLDATGVTVKETANQSGRVSLVNLRADSTTALKITVHMANGEAYDYTSEITTKDADEQGAIEVVETIEESDGFDVYTTSGACVRSNATDLSGLRPGIYVANGRKYIVR